MPTISSAGVGSGLDVSGLVEKLVTAEGEPVRIRLDRKEAELQAGLSAMGTFKGVVSEFQSSLEALRNPDTFGSIDISSSNEEVIEASAGNEAQPGEYEVEILQLAAAHKLSSDAFDSDRKPMGSGTLSIQLGRFDEQSQRFLMNPDFPVKTLTLTEENSSMRGIQEAINEAGAGVRASVINDGSGYRLVLSSEIAGKENSIRLIVNDDDGRDSDLSGLSNLAYDPTAPQGGTLNMTEVVATEDAKLVIDGIPVTRANNEIADVIDGVTLKLNPGAEGKVSRLKVGLNTASISEAVNSFIAKYNEMINTVNALTGYDPETKTAGPLSGDASIRGVVSQIRRTLGDNFGGVNQTWESLSSIGIDTQRDGSLVLDNSKLQTAIENNLQEVVQLFAVAGSASDPAIRYLEANENTATGAYQLEITRMPRRGYYASSIIAPSPLAVYEGGNSFELKVDGVKSSKLELTAKTYNDAEDLAFELQSIINADEQLQRQGVSVKVKSENNRLLLISDRYGSASGIDVVAADTGLINSLGMAISKGEPGTDVAGTLNGAAAFGSGRILSGKGAAEDLKIEVLEGATGERGTVYFSHGVAARLHELTQSFLDRDGIINVRSDGYSDRIADISKEREKLGRKLAVSEERYMKQFSSLDALLGKMRSTGEFLDQQLSSLPGASGAKAGGK